MDLMNDLPSDAKVLHTVSADICDRDNELPLVMKVEDIAKLLGIGRNTAYNLVNCGVVKSIRIGRQIRIPRSALMEYLSSPDA